tara:strand:- start:432 stop:665 length:234 start_codon:yes stop_codon:yes gene_type:complete
MENKEIKCKDCKCDKDKCKQDTYLHAIRVMYNHLGVNSTKNEKSLLKSIENELLKIANYDVKTLQRSKFYFDKDRNK